MFWCEYPRDVVQVRGADAASYLQSQVSQDLRELQQGQSAWTFVLQPTGKIDVLARVWRTGDDEFTLDTDAGFGEALSARLNRFRIRVKAEVQAPAAAWRCIAVRGDVGEAPAGALAGWGGGYDLLGPAEEVEPPAGVPAGSAADLDAARVDAVWPAMGSEIVPGETIPAETGVTALAVSFTKGCYPGQELVERMDSRGAKPPRLLQRVVGADGTPVLAYVARAALQD